MLWLFLLVLISPTLKFDGLTMQQVINWLNLHPFIFVFMLTAIFRGFYRINFNKGE